MLAFATDIDIDKDIETEIEIDTVIDTEKEHPCGVQLRTQIFESAGALSFYHITAIIHICYHLLAFVSIW